MINHLKKKDFTTEQITESGLCKLGPSGDAYDFFRKRIMFPIWDQVGNVIAFTGRVLDPQDTPKYLNITNTPLYDKSKALYGINFVKKYINEHQKIIVVE
jgi:DNA primase